MYGQIIGGMMQIGGTYLAGNAASARQKKLNDVANAPGVNFNDIYKDSLGAMDNNVGTAQDIAHKENVFGNAELQAALEASMPGYGAMQKSRINNATDLLAGKIPDDVAGQVYRSAGAKALEGGYGGTPAGRNLTARDFGLTSLDLQGKGQQYASGIISSTPRSVIHDGSEILNITPHDALQTRSAERSKMLDLLVGAAQAPGASDVWSKFLVDKGSQMQGSGSGATGMAGMGSVMGSF